MAKLSNYTGSVELIDGLKPANNNDFPLMEAHDVLVANDGQRLDDKLTTLDNNLTTLNNTLSKVPEMRYDTTTKVLTIIITE